jgi:uncharacterized protein (TIGR03437 family)
MAFPSDFERKQYFYVSYTDRGGTSVISRFRVSAANPNAADPGSETVILRQTQPFSNHNGGQIRFGRDGYLYIGFGDGGSGGDPMRHGQNGRSLLGKLLRIDVESDLVRYRIPPDNPFVNDALYLPEIWATGLRNPWRFSFDRETGDLWIADVGQDRFEEVHFVPGSSRGGENYGWNFMEGLACFLANCDPAATLPPVHAYGRNEGASVTGGFVYRGARWPSLRGLYFYGDYTNGRIWALRREGSRFVNQFLLGSGLSISSFGEDQAGELYVADHGAGAIYRLGSTGQPQEPRLAIGAVVNAASNVAGVVAGSAATIYSQGITDGPGITSATTVPLPTTLAGVRASVNGREAPLFAVANSNGNEQVNIQVPFEAAGTTATIVVSRGGLSSEPMQVPLLAVQPGVFTSDGAHAIVVHHSNNMLVTAGRPLRRGDYGYFYVTGLGAVDNQPLTGRGGPRGPLAMVRAPVAVTLGGVPCDVLFAGLAPDLAAVYQVNFRVGQAVASGAVDLVVSSGGASSPPAKVFIE